MCGASLLVFNHVSPKHYDYKERACPERYPEQDKHPVTSERPLLAPGSPVSTTSI